MASWGTSKWMVKTWKIEKKWMIYGLSSGFWEADWEGCELSLVTCRNRSLTGFPEITGELSQWRVCGEFLVIKLGSCWLLRPIALYQQVHCLLSDIFLAMFA